MIVLYRTGCTVVPEQSVCCWRMEKSKVKEVFNPGSALMLLNKPLAGQVLLLKYVLC
jgi:hypothetical protein